MKLFDFIDRYYFAVLFIVVILLLLGAAWTLESCHSESPEERQYQDSITQKKLDDSIQKWELEHPDTLQYNEDIPH